MNWLQKIAEGKWVTWMGNADAHYVHIPPKARFEYPDLIDEHNGITLCGIDIPGRGSFPASPMSERCPRCVAELRRQRAGWPNH